MKSSTSYVKPIYINNSLYGMITYFTSLACTSLYKMNKLQMFYMYILALCWLCLGLCIRQTLEITSDPCENYDSSLNQEKRSVTYTTDYATDFVINDVHFPGDTWYRPVTSLGTNMPTSHPGMFKCGTKNPIWLNGQLPEVAEGEVTRQVCTQTFTGLCSRYWDISVKNCQDEYYVYRLKAALEIDSGYCFGSGSVPCPVGQSSETGYYPGCKDVGFPNDTITPEVSSTLEFKPPTALHPVFRCNIGRNVDPSYYIDVHWFINEKSVIELQNIPNSNIKKADLLPEHWIGKHHMNMIVKCSVRIRFGVDTLPSPNHDSEWFQAGVFPTRFQHQVIEGESTTITYNVTVPVGCDDYSRLAHCNHILYITQPNYQINQPQCSNDVKQQDLAFDSQQNCGLSIPSSYTGKDVIFKTVGYINGQYDGRTRTTKIRLKSKDKNLIDKSGVWDYIAIPEIEVVVTDADQEMKGRFCQAWNDPHFYTSDRRRYDFYGTGMYVLYRHKTRPYEVQAIFTKCNRNRASCHCGIAIRSGNSMLSIRLCSDVPNGAQRKSIGRTSPNTRKIICDDKSLYYKIEGRRYTVTLPIGTQIIFEVGRTYINYVNIKPSVLDLEENEGLCGYVSKQNQYKDDDFMKNDRTITQDSQEFARSWKVNETDSLFVSHPKLLKETNYLSSYCECTTEATHLTAVSDHNELKCNLTEHMEQCNKQEVGDTYKSECSNGESRRRREAEYLTNALDDVDDDYPDLVIDPSVYDETIQQNYEWSNGWTYERAEQECMSYFTERFPDEVSEASGVKISDYLTSCIADIQISGTTEYMSITLSTMQSFALTELKKNATLAEESTDGRISVLEQLTNQLCENDCSNNGVCVNGSCVCDEHFGDFDCSISKKDAPSEVRIPSSGLCRTRFRPCKRTNIYGRFSSEVVYCKRRHFQIEGNQKSYTSDAEITNATVYDSFKVSCGISSSRKKRSVDNNTIMAEGYELSVSNDGKNFSDIMVIVIYDDMCYSCNASTSTCEATSSCKSKHEAQKQTLDIIIFVTAVVGFSVVTAAVIVIVIYCKLKRKTNNPKRHLVKECEANKLPPCFVRTNKDLSLNYGRKTPDHLFLAKAN